MPQSVGYIAATIPARIFRTSGTTLFHLAAEQTGDALQWVAIARFNAMLDPWIDARTDVYVPPIFPSGTQDGILGQ